MSDLEEISELNNDWDEFLRCWPPARLGTMNLPEYTEVQNPDTYTYWLEYKLKGLGSVGGGSSFWKGIFHRSTKDKRENGRGRIYTEEYAFHQSCGETPEEAFRTIKEAILRVVKAVRERDLISIDKEQDLPHALKWKTAFLYQDREHPICPAIYATPMLRRVTGSPKNLNHLYALNALMARYDGKEDILAFSIRAWSPLHHWEHSGYDPKIDKDTWIDLLNDPEIGTANVLTLLARMRDLGYEATASQLVEKFDGSVSFYNACVVALGRSVLKKLGRTAYVDPGKGKECFWVVPFLGRPTHKELDAGIPGEFLWQVRRPLKNAIKTIHKSDSSSIRWADYLHRKIESGTSKETDDMNTAKKERDEIDGIVDLLRLKKNLILQGAPGTGKTYRIPEIVTRLCGATKAGDDRTKIMDAYRDLKKQGRVDFTTFHPSLDYEHFVEGWQPVNPKDVADEDPDADPDEASRSDFELADGIFKHIADRASQGTSSQVHGPEFAEDLHVWKVSLGGSHENDIRTDCLKNHRIRIDWGNEAEPLEQVIEERKAGYRPLRAFCNRMKKGDIVVSCYSQTETDAIGIIESDFYWLPQSDFSDYRLCRAVRWLWQGKPVSIEAYMDGYSFTLGSVYSVTRRFTPSRVQSFLAERSSAHAKTEYPPYVLVIDEINRGNISKIFGELITLLEVDKRRGGNDEASCKLPYSKKTFLVPDNLYIIGTMNTADRSIGMIDYALRRRFVFYALRPQILNREDFDKELFLAVSSLFVQDPHAEVLAANRDTLSEEFDPLDVWPGHSYFLMPGTSRSLRYRFEIRPLLLEYIRDGVLKQTALERIRKMEEQLSL